MTTGGSDLPTWHYAMAAAARHLAFIDAEVAKHPSRFSMSTRAEIAKAWVAYAAEVTAHDQAPPAGFRR